MIHIVRLISALAFILIPSALSAQPQCAKPRDFAGQDRIVGGRLAVIENWPGQAVLRVKTPKIPRYVCGGTLIQSDLVLTAAHCVAGWSKGKTGWVDAYGNSAEVVIGTDDLRAVDQGEVYQIADIILHEAYISASRGNDIALIRLPRPSTAERTRLSLSGRSDPSPSSLTPLMVAGFGLQTEGAELAQFNAIDGSAFFAGASRLLETVIPLADPESCKKVYANRFGEKQICAGFVVGGKDSCQGDSGGPLVAFDRTGCPYQVGLVSWGVGCARPDSYGIYTRLSSFTSWIKQHAPDVRAIALEDLNAPISSRNALVESISVQLREELSGAVGRAKISIVNGTRLRLGEFAVFRLSTEISGRPLLIDINAKGEVNPLFPYSNTVPVRLAPGQDFIIPDNSAYFFPVQEPSGVGKLIALVVPDHFNFVALEEARQTKGFGVQASLSYFQNLIQLIRSARGRDKGIGVKVTDTVAIRPSNQTLDWALADLDYEVLSK